MRRSRPTGGPTRSSPGRSVRSAPSSLRSGCHISRPRSPRPWSRASPTTPLPNRAAPAWWRRSLYDRWSAFTEADPLFRHEPERREFAMSLDYEIYNLGDVKLQRGATLRDCKLAYKTFGTLSPSKDNVIVYPTWYSGQHYDNEWLVGDGRALDPKKYFIIIPNMLGNGLSSSPSNTPEQAFYRQKLDIEALGYSSLEDFLVAFWEGFFLPKDPNNLLTMLWTWQNGDIGDNELYNGDFKAALGAIKAKAYVMPGQTDLYFPPEDIEFEVAHMPNAKLVTVPSVWGHFAGGPGTNPKDVEFIDAKLKELLAS